MDRTVNMGMSGAVRASAAFGVAAAPKIAQAGGVRSGAMGIAPPKAPPPPSCGGITKDGTRCKANPVKGQPLCAGHRRQVEALARKAEAA